MNKLINHIVVFSSIVVIALSILSSCDLQIGKEIATSSLQGRALYQNSNDHSGITITLEPIVSERSLAVSRALGQQEESTGRSNLLVHQTSTDNKGNYLIENILPGIYSIYASSHTSQERAVYTYVNIPEGNRLTAPDLNLTSIGAIKGKVQMNGSDVGNTGFVVFVAGTSYIAITNDEGSFQINSIPSGSEYSLVIMKGFKSLLWDKVMVNPGSVTDIGIKEVSLDVLPDLVSISWKGSHHNTDAEELLNPQLNWAYHNLSDGNSYIFDGSNWVLLTRAGDKGADGQDGRDGADGQDGRDGTNGISIIWKGELSGHPLSPQQNWAYYNSDAGKSYIFDGNTWQILAKDGANVVAIYRLNYNENDAESGSIPEETIYYADGQIVTVLDNSGDLFKEGYEFSGWNTKSDRSGINYLPGDTLTISSEDITLFAIWEKVYLVGQIGPAGGKIFYVDNDDLYDGWKYLEFAPKEDFVELPWGYDTYLVSGTSSDIGAGMTNTNIIISYFGHSFFYYGNNNYAAKYCFDYSLNGYSDWFLPSQGELALLAENSWSLGLWGLGNGGGTPAWSSSADGRNNAFMTYLTSKTSFSWARWNTPLAIPIRRF